MKSFCFLAAISLVLPSQLLAQEIATPCAFTDLTKSPYKFAGLIQTEWSQRLGGSPIHSRGSGVVAGHPRVALTAGHVVYDTKGYMDVFQRMLSPTGRWAASASWHGINATGAQPSTGSGTLLEIARSASYSHLRAYELAADKERGVKDRGGDNATASPEVRAFYTQTVLSTAELDLATLISTTDLVADSEYCALQTSPSNAEMKNAALPKLLLGFPVNEYEINSNPELWSMYRIGPLARPFDSWSGHPGALVPVPEVEVWGGNSGGPWLVRSAVAGQIWTVGAIVGRGDGNAASVTSPAARKLITDAIKIAQNGQPYQKLAGDINLMFLNPGVTLPAYMGEAPGDVDVFRIKITEEGEYSMGTNGAVDTVGTLVCAGEPTVVDDNSGQLLNFRMNLHLKAKTYDLRVRAASPNAQGSYSCYLTQRYTVGTPSLACATVVGTKVTELVKSNDASGPAQVAPVTFPAHTSGKSPTRVTFRVRNAGGGSLNFSGVPAFYISGHNAAAFTLQNEPLGGLATGSYEEFTIIFQANQSGIHQALLTIQSDDVLKPEVTIPLRGEGKLFTTSDDHVNTTAVAIRAGGIIDAASQPIANLETASDVDIFSLQVPSQEVYHIYTEGLTDTVGTLYQVKGITAVKLVTEDNFAGDRNFSISRILTPGSYLVAVSLAKGKSPGPYLLRVNHLAPSGLLAVEGSTKALIPDDDIEASAALGCDFGPGPFPKPVTKVFTLRNYGTAALTISAVVSNNGNRFVASPPKAGVLAPGASTTFTLTHQPLAGALHMTSIIISAQNAGISDGTFTFDVKAGAEPIVPLPAIGQLAASKQASYYIKPNGNLQVWGYNNRGALGVPMPDQFTYNILVPTQAPFTFFGPYYLAAGGGDHAQIAFNSLGDVYGWGNPYYVSFGNGVIPGSNPSVATSLVPATKNWPGGVAHMAMGTWHTVVVGDDGGVWAWGQQDEGEVGNGVIRTAVAATPVNITSRFGGAKILRVAAGTNHTLALDSYGIVWSWGFNNHGPLGIGTLSGSKAVPTKIPSTSFGGKRIVGIGCTAYSSLAVDEENTLWAWGDNSRGTLGDGTFTHRSKPVPVMDPNTHKPHTFLGEKIIQIAGGGDTAAILTDAGSVWAIGEVVMVNVDMRSPFSYTASQLQSWTYQAPEPIYMVVGSALSAEHVIELAVGGERSGYRLNPGNVLVELSLSHILLRTADNSVWAFGANNRGQLGTGGFTSSTAPVLVLP